MKEEIFKNLVGCINSSIKEKKSLKVSGNLGYKIKSRRTNFNLKICFS